MSLFGTHEWWSATIDAQEEFDQGSLCIGNIDNEPSGAMKIITGSFEGILRIYFPRNAEYRIEDLMVEQSLGQPILQIEIGRFIPSSKHLALAVLHPRQVVVYQIGAMGGTGKSASYYSVVKAYEHQLEDTGVRFTAANMTFGPFGAANAAKDFICVQSMDGRVQFYEQDHFAFSTKFADCLVPGPLCYCPSSDCIVTCNSKREIVAYKYQVLASSSVRKEGSRDQDWCVNIGEHAFDIFVARYSRNLSPGTSDILVLGEHSMFCITERGKIRMQKRLDYHVAACRTFARGAGKDGQQASENLLVATHSQRVLVYRDAQLVWAARIPHRPVAIRVSNFGTLNGLIVTLTEGGRLSLSYLGTDSQTGTVLSRKGKDLDYGQMDEEYRRLLSDIRSTQNQTAIEPQQKVTMRTQVPDVLDTLNEDDTIMLNEKVEAGMIAAAPNGGAVRLTVRLFVGFSGQGKMKHLNVSVATRAPVMCDNPVSTIPGLRGGGTPYVMPLVYYCAPNVTPSSLVVNVAITYMDGGNARTAYHEFKLPLIVVAKPVAPAKISDYKFTVDTNKDPVLIASLFKPFIEQPNTPEWVLQKYSSAGANVLSIEYWNGEIATVLVSKNAGRYRIQSSTLQALWMLTEAVVQRLREHFGEGAGFEMLFNDILPLKDYFGVVEHHFDVRNRLSNFESELNDRAQQFRAIQKRLLVRFKDKNPPPLNHLDTLLKDTYSSIMDLGTQITASQQDLLVCAAQLSSCTELIVFLMGLKFGFDDRSTEILKAHLTPLVSDSDLQGWEECVDSAMTHLLRTVLAKSAKDTSSMPLPIAMPADTTKLQRHIGVICNRLSQKGSLAV